MDGLLIDTEGYWQTTERDVFKELGIEISREMQIPTMGLRSDEQIRYWYDYRPWKKMSIQEVENRYTEVMLEYFSKKAVLMEGAIEALDFFSNKGIPIALASSSNMKLINAFLDKFAFHHYFREVYSAEFEPYGKPHPGVYLETARRLNTSPVNCLAIEDSFHGLIAAKAARMITIAVPDHYEARFNASDIVLDSLIQLSDDIYQKLNHLQENETRS
jgi:sugar-phosphatase